MIDDRYHKLMKSIKSFCKERDWEKFHDPKNLAISLNLESSEVLELFQWTLDNQINFGKKNEIAGELADVLYWLMMLADYYDIDLLTALEEKMLINEQKYPIEKAKGVSTKYNDFKL